MSTMFNIGYMSIGVGWYRIKKVCPLDYENEIWKESQFVFQKTIIGCTAVQPQRTTNGKHTIMFMIIYMLRKTLNGINDLIVYKFVSDNDVE